jgi:hypothetical protein
MTNAELIELLREAEDLLAENVCGCLKPACLGFRNRLAVARIDAALSSPQAARTEGAERQDAEMDVVKSDEGDGFCFYKDETHRLILEKNHLLVQRSGVRRWYWCVNRESDGQSIGRGTCTTEAEAKEAAIKAARGMR